jgi:ABC-type sugar transport system substrate-binding protein
MKSAKRFLMIAFLVVLLTGLVVPASAQDRPVKIGYVVHVTGIEFTAIVEQGARDAAKDYNVDLVFTGPPAIDHPAQIAEFDALLETGLDGIVFIAGDPSVWAEPVKRAIDKGVVVLTADADAPNTDRLAFFGVDAQGLGEMLGRQVRALVGDSGKIVLGECVIGPEPHVLREAGFRSAFEGTSVEFVGPYETVCDATQNFTNWQSAYTANQDAAAIVGLTAVETASLGRLKQETGGSFVVGSFDPGAEGLRQMIDGNVDVTVGQNPYLAGYLPVQAIARHVREGLAINPGVNLYPGELILPENAEGLLEREGGGQPRTDWYKQFIADNHLKDFGLVVQK